MSQATPGHYHLQRQRSAEEVEAQLKAAVADTTSTLVHNTGALEAWAVKASRYVVDPFKILQSLTVQAVHA
jgi:hypothetical protein